jgi:hypothetical protein
MRRRSFGKYVVEEKHLKEGDSFEKLRVDARITLKIYIANRRQGRGSKYIWFRIGANGGCGENVDEIVSFVKL